MCLKIKTIKNGQYSIELNRNERTSLFRLLLTVNGKSSCSIFLTYEDLQVWSDWCGYPMQHFYCESIVAPTKKRDEFSLYRNNKNQQTVVAFYHKNQEVRDLMVFDAGHYGLVLRLVRQRIQEAICRDPQRFLMKTNR